MESLLEYLGRCSLGSKLGAQGLGGVATDRLTANDLPTVIIVGGSRTRSQAGPRVQIQIHGSACTAAAVY